MFHLMLRHSGRWITMTSYAENHIAYIHFSNKSLRSWVSANLDWFQFTTFHFTYITCTPMIRLTPTQTSWPCRWLQWILFFYSGNWTFITSLDKIKFSCVTIETSRSDEGTFSRRRLVENFVMWVRNREGIQAWMPSRPPPRHHSAFFYLNYTVMASVFDPVSATLGQESRHQFYWVAQHCTLLCPPASKKKKSVLLNLNSDVLHRQLKDQRRTVSSSDTVASDSLTCLYHTTGNILLRNQIIVVSKQQHISDFS